MTTFAIFLKKCKIEHFYVFTHGKFILKAFLDILETFFEVCQIVHWSGYQHKKGTEAKAKNPSKSLRYSEEQGVKDE